MPARLRTRWKTVAVSHWGARTRRLSATASVAGLRAITIRGNHEHQQPGDDESRDHAEHPSEERRGPVEDRAGEQIEADATTEKMPSIPGGGRETWSLAIRIIPPRKKPPTTTVPM